MTISHDPYVLPGAPQTPEEALAASDYLYVSDIQGRSQHERVEAFAAMLCEASQRLKLGHMMLVVEAEIDGQATVLRLHNHELAELQGKTGVLRASEMLEVALFETWVSGLPKMPLGVEAGLEWGRKRYEMLRRSDVPAVSDRDLGDENDARTEGDKNAGK